MARHDQQLNFRVAHENLYWVKEEALKNRRSLTAQMNWILEEMRRISESKNSEATGVKS